MRVSVLVCALCVTVAACGGVDGGDTRPAENPAWALALETGSAGTSALLQAISPVSDDVVWVSGHRAAWARSLDGGTTWHADSVAGAAGLQFRDVAAFDENVAYLMSSGSGALSRIYRTDDGGLSWALQYTATHPDAFLDCMDFWTPDRGLVYGDEVDGVPFILSTENGGASWTRVLPDALPAALEGEGGFAASGTCLVVGADGQAWIATGAGERARVLRTADYGATWAVSDAPVVGGSAAGLSTLQMSDGARGIALGGVIGEDSIRSENVATTEDAGVTWQIGGPLAMDGPVYGSAWVPQAMAPLVVAVGPRGLDWSDDGGATWRSGSTETYWAVAFASPRRGWAVGPGGRVLRLSFASH